MITWGTTYREYDRLLLSAIENNALEELRETLFDFLKENNNAYLANLFSARVNEIIGDLKKAENYYKKTAQLVRTDHEVGTKKLHSEITRFAKKYPDNTLGNITYRLSKITEFKQPTYSYKVPIKPVKVEDPYQELIKEGNTLFSQGKFKESITKFIKYEKSGGPKFGKFYLYIINSARGAKDDQLALKYINIGLEYKDKTIDQYITYIKYGIPIWRKSSMWKEMRDVVENYIERARSPEKFIMRAYIECNIKLKDLEGTKKALDEFLSEYPNDYKTIKLKSEYDSLISIGEKKGSTINKKVSKDPNEKDFIKTKVQLENMKIMDEKSFKYLIGKKNLQDFIDLDAKKAMEDSLAKDFVDPEAKKAMEDSLAEDFVDLEAKKAMEDSNKRKQHLFYIMQNIYSALEDELSDEINIELKQTRAYEISPMLRADVSEHKLQDPIIIRRGGQPIAEDADRLIADADNELKEIYKKDQSEMFTLYGRYLEASKAYFELPDDDYKDFLYQRALGRYASLRAGDFFDKYKTEITKKDDSDLIQNLKDSTSSYYYEALRLKLDIEREEGNPGFIIAEEVLLNYLRLNTIHFMFKEGQSLKKEIFNSNYIKTAQILFSSDSGKRVLAKTFLSIGAANPENFTAMFSPLEKTKLLNGQPYKFLTSNKQVIVNLFSELTGFNYNADEEINDYLKRIFEDVSNNRHDKILQQFNVIREIGFNPREINHLQEEWNILSDIKDPLVFNKSDSRVLEEIENIIDIYVPYMKSSPEERDAIISGLKNEISILKDRIHSEPTYWIRSQFQPLLINWIKSLNRQKDLKTKYTRPKIIINVDPECIMVTNDGGEFTVSIENIGAANVNKVKCQLKFIVDDKNLFDVNENFSDDELSPGMKDSITFGFESTIMNLLKDKIIKCEVIVSGDHINQKIESKERYTLNIQTNIPLKIEDIPWHETRKVPENMFKGRDELIEQLIKHYLSNDRVETWILYGLTRHGKSSIHEYLAKSLLQSDPVETIQHGTLKIIPFEWEFGEAANCHDARELWYYLVKLQILDKIEEYALSGILPERIIYESEYIKLYNISDGSFRSSHFKKSLLFLVKNGYLPFFSVDEFTYYTEMIDKGIISLAFFASIRKITIEDEIASFIFAGAYDLIEIVNDDNYGITSHFANIRDHKVAGIDRKSSTELIQIMGEKLLFTNDAVDLIQSVSDNIPYFIQIICRRCGNYAVQNGKNIMGSSDVEKVIQFMTGEKTDSGSLLKKIKRLETSLFQNTQYRPNEVYRQALISTIASRSIDKDGNIRTSPVDIANDEIISIWGNHRDRMIINFQGNLQNSIESLEKRGVIKRTKTETFPFYQLSVDIFRRWWNVEHPYLYNELDKLIQMEIKDGD